MTNETRMTFIQQKQRYCGQTADGKSVSVAATEFAEYLEDRTNEDDLYDPKFWISLLGINPSVEVK